MIFYIIPTLIIVASIAGIVYILLKKFPNIANINIETIAKEKESKVINRIMTDRLSRKVADSKKVAKEISQPILDVLGQGFNNFYQKITELEKKNIKNQPLKQIDINQNVKDKISTIKGLLADADFTKAEDLAIEVIEMDDKNLDAYESLVQACIETKEYKKARETCRYLAKLLGKDDDNHRLANCYADLGTIYELENKISLAMKNFQKAVELEPNNPRFLDLLLKISIILKNKPLAQEVFESLKKADPDNGKLTELKEEINGIKTA